MIGRETVTYISVVISSLEGMGQEPNSPFSYELIMKEEMGVMNYLLVNLLRKH